MLKLLKEACGVFGAQDFKRDSVFPYIYWGLRSQNHRGHQSHGFITFDREFNLHRELGLVPKIEREDLQNWLTRLPGHVGIGSIRYTTSGGTDEESLIKGIQPFLAETDNAKIAMAFNGNIVNNSQLKREIRVEFPDFTYACDAELLCRKLLLGLEESRSLASSVTACMRDVEGAFSVAGITQRGELFAFRDPCGIRPLCCGYSEDKNICAVSSETVGLDIGGLEFDFEVEPGELVVASENGFKREQLVKCESRALCGFEFAYFARPDSRIGDRYVYEIREDFGRNLGKEYTEITEDADIIISIPQTSNDAAYGLHEETGIRWERASRRHRYVTERAFILLPRERHSTIDKKINILDRRLHGKNIAVVEDSIVRGDTTKTIVQKLRRKGAKRVDLFITFPRIIGPCFYGIDMATYGELIGSKHNAQEIAEIIDADTVNYQSLEGLVRATGLTRDKLCLGCITSEYPTPLAQKMANKMKERFEGGHKERGRIYELASEQTIS
ncbi:MAG: amidophosphoribosyltransferase [Candidatus Bathyarchaeota archaeon]|nr:MAG: amidophosphoribosyltransferase [Candidatus Bathyarchaeota archaeon]